LRRYEAMFLFNNTVARDWSAVTAEVQRLLGRIEAQLEVCVKFDERKLAYEIAGSKRGTYVLVYFQSRPEKITQLEHDAKLTESILRLLVLKADKVTDQRIAELKAHPAEQPLVPLAAESRRSDDDRGGRDRWDRGGDRGGRPPRREGEGAPAPVGATEGAAPSDAN
jgi:ribosomal protein S6